VASLRLRITKQTAMAPAMKTTLQPTATPTAMPIVIEERLDEEDVAGAVVEVVEVAEVVEVVMNDVEEVVVAVELIRRELGSREARVVGRVPPGTSG
jgi:predicted DNA-binding protein